MIHPAVARLRAAVAERPRPPQVPVLQPRTVIALVAADFDMAARDLTSRETGSSVVRARYAAMAVLKAARPDLSFPRIGQLFARHHSTVISALSRVREWMDADPEYRAKVQRLLDAVAPRPSDTVAEPEKP